MAVVKDNDKVEGRCKHNNQIEVMVAGGQYWTSAFNSLTAVVALF
jgi:hypothetical protein